MANGETAGLFLPFEKKSMKIKVIRPENLKKANRPSRVKLKIKNNKT